MYLDLFVDTSRKGTSLALSSNSKAQRDVYVELVNPQAKGETLSATLDELLLQAQASLSDIGRVMVTLGPGSFSGLRTGVAFCQGLCFSGKHQLYGVSTLQALAYFERPSQASGKAIVVIRARSGYWYLRKEENESFISTEELLKALENVSNSTIVADDDFASDKAFEQFIQSNKISIANASGKLNAWAPLFDIIKPTLIQSANYIQPSYFEKIKA
ncbi:MAG: tRNA (adenosine(37)-N6)-threonylcarbamoyltransferase complex dimerization subunit type 1 TsaB [Fibrobacteraceae bacterium]|nr:tRNA (adenosine(37)-N6)-threonylcarbamoyltransferase complex dimerization subunit type 1 TsaB [Fibrobacteraceae bacterium]